MTALSPIAAVRRPVAGWYAALPASFPDASDPGPALPCGRPRSRSAALHCAQGCLDKLDMTTAGYGPTFRTEMAARQSPWPMLTSMSGGAE
jgi:hypothetical protein